MNDASCMFAPRSAPLITVVSASGGTGKSTLSLIVAFLAARQGIDTALVEGDLQFGDMGFWLGMDIDLPNLSDGCDCAPITISDHLDLYKAPPLPELAEEVSEAVARLVPTIRNEHDLVIADTGQFWSGLTGELLCSSDLVLLVMDQREASVYGAIKALELCQRLGVPSARIVCVSNRSQGKSRSSSERICSALGIEELFCLSEGKTPVESLISTGRVEELVESDSAPVPDVGCVLGKILPRVGIDFSQQKPRKARRFFS